MFAGLTKNFTERAVQFIEKSKDKPFFLYLPHPMVHVPLHASPEFEGKSGKGLFADVMLEIDWSIGRLTDTLKKLGLEDNTLVVYSSDNGPWLSYGDHAGSSGPFREGKGTSWEGGKRVTGIMRWPGKIPAGTSSNAMLMTIDLLPTLANHISAKLPDHPIDGKDVMPLLTGPDTTPTAPVPSRASTIQSACAAPSARRHWSSPARERSSTGNPARSTTR